MKFLSGMLSLISVVFLCGSFSLILAQAISPQVESDFDRGLRLSRETYDQEVARKQRTEDVLLRRLAEESKRLERIRTEAFRQEERALERALKLSKENFEKEKKRREFERVEQQVLQQKVDIETEAEKEKREVAELKKWLAERGADELVVVNNVNVNVDLMELQESDGTVRKAMSRGHVGAISDIPIKMENKPFIFSIISGGKRYRWKIPEFKSYGLELGLIEKTTPQGPKIILQTIEESGATSKYPRGFVGRKVIPLMDVDEAWLIEDDFKKEPQTFKFGNDKKPRK